MAKFSKGLYGAYTGKVGSMVGSTWKGIEVLRSKPAKGRTSFSPEQLQQQAKFSMIGKFLKPLSPFINTAYGSTAKRMTGVNQAFAYNVQNGITGDYPDFKINYPMIQLGQGILPNAASAAGSSAAAGKLTVTWPDNTGDGSAQSTDAAFVAVYSEDLIRWIVIQNAAQRSAGSCTIDIPAFSGKTVQAYLGFISAKGRKVSTTLFVGPINVL